MKKMRENNKVIYISDNLVQVGGINFRISTTDCSLSTDDCNVALLKPKDFLDYYENLIFKNNVKNVVEFGIFEGGMSVFLTSLKKDLRYLGFDIMSPVVGLQNFLNRHGEIGQRIFTHFNMGQSDPRTPKLIADFLEGEELDLIIDDASHQYFQTRKTFELSFPILKEGGRYIIEDWGWLHWGGFEKPVQWKDSEALTNLVLELVMLCASNPEVIVEINVFPSMVIVKKGKQQITGDFVLEDYIRNYMSINQAHLTEWDEQIADLKQAVSECNESNKSLNIQMDSTKILLQSFKDEIDRIYNSKSWKLTKPLRAFRRVFNVFYLMIRRFTS
jgi:SAM-dependent methyltransferase